jgi:hypothetical protein
LIIRVTTLTMKLITNIFIFIFSRKFDIDNWRLWKKEITRPTPVRMLELQTLSYWHWAGYRIEKIWTKRMLLVLEVLIAYMKFFLEDSSFGLLRSFYFLFMHCEPFFWWFFDIKKSDFDLCKGFIWNECQISWNWNWNWELALS